MTLCDGRIGVYDQRQQLVDIILPANYSADTTMVNTLNVSRNSSQLYYTDAAYPHSVFRYDLTQRAVVQTWSNASSQYESLAVDERDQSVYACNNINEISHTPTIDHYAANGTLLTSTHLLDGTAPATSLAISYSAKSAHRQYRHCGVGCQPQYRQCYCVISVSLRLACR